jgi:DNA-directed RNA polymerase subunit RPC12/RpoP
VRHPYLLFSLALGGAVLIGLGRPVFQTIVAMVVIYGSVLFGMMLLGGLARPVPEPPPAGELRKVKIQYRCSLCGAEVRMTVAPNQEPQPPRHCQEDMDLVAPVE